MFLIIHFVPKYAAFFNYAIHNFRLYLYDRALIHYRKAMRRFFALGDNASRARIYNRLAALSLAFRQGKAASLLYGRALRLALAAGDSVTEALTFQDLGNLLRRYRKWDRAKACYDKAMEVYQTMGGVYYQAMLRLDLARLAYRQDRRAEGQENVLVALRLSQESQESYLKKTALQAVARLWRKSHDRALPEVVAGVLGTTKAKAKEILRKAI